MDVLKRLAQSGVVPVVVLEDAKDAVPTAKAMLAGGGKYLNFIRILLKKK